MLKDEFKMALEAVRSDNVIFVEKKHRELLVTMRKELKE